MSEPFPRKQNVDQRASALAAALDSMYGYSPYVATTDVLNVARSEFGFDGTLEEVVSLLPTVRDVTIERAERIEDYRVKVNTRPPQSPRP